MWKLKMDSKIIPISIFLICTLNFCEAAINERYYKTLKFEVPLDHFSFANNKTFKIRYLLNDTFWDKENGPIFFYTGNEGSIEVFANITGFMWEIADEFQALLVFAEHRYYGESLPFGNKSLSEPQYSGYLSTTQALADYVDLITSLKKNSSGRHPVVAFGGSYGGMLSAYLRMKYPHVVDGAIAASAPMHQFTGMIPCDAFYRVTTSAYVSESLHCAQNIRNSWETIRNMTKTAEGKKWMKKEWNLCTDLKADNDTQALIDYLTERYTVTAMMNYPYENNFIGSLPAYPIKQFCYYLKNQTLKDKPLLKALYSAIDVLVNHTGKEKCLNFLDSAYNDNLGDDGWDYQSCTEMVMPMCSNGQSDMFEKVEWNEKKFSDDCKSKYGVTPQFDLAEKEYGGDKLQAASNIVFSNGLLDPWVSGGILKNFSTLTFAVIIPEGAHHLDLMSANPNDPYTAIFTRNYHKYFIKEWIKENNAT